MNETAVEMTGQVIELHVQMLLSLAEGMSGGHTSLDKLIQRIMIDAQDLIKCARCNVFVFDSTRTDQVFIFVHIYYKTSIQN